MRALSTIRRCTGVKPIPGADAIEATQVGGWVCVTRKGSFQPDDLGLYFEIDSFLPAGDERFAFLEKQFTTYLGKRGARLRTIKLRGCLSQGLFLPLADFPELAGIAEGEDVTEILGVKKWEPTIPSELSGQVIGGLPSFIRTTDQERIQNLSDRLDTDIIGHRFEQTVKLDGTSMTAYFYEGKFGVCGRNWEYPRGDYFTLQGFLKRKEWGKAFKALFFRKRFRKKADNTFWRVADQIGLSTATELFYSNMALQGELIGEGIQGNPEGLKGQDFYVFDVWNIDEKRYLTPAQRELLIGSLRAQHGLRRLKSVPYLDSITFDAGTTIESILNMADGPSLLADNREGVVFKRKDGKFSFKAISNFYLLKHGDR